MAKGDDIQERLLELAAGIIKLSNKIPASFAGRHIANQIVRSGTSAAANYSEARAAESRNDFIHKMRIVLKELNETNTWFELIIRSDLMKTEILQSLRTESREIARIIVASIQTATKKRT